MANGVAVDLCLVGSRTRLGIGAPPSVAHLVLENGIGRSGTSASQIEHL